MRKENYHSGAFLSERTRPVEDLLRWVLGCKRRFANGFTVLLRIGVFRDGIYNNVCQILKGSGVTP